MGTKEELWKVKGYKLCLSSDLTQSDVKYAAAC